LRFYILTPAEKKIIKDFMDNNKITESTYTLIGRIKIATENIQADLKIIKDFYEEYNNRKES